MSGTRFRTENKNSCFVIHVEGYFDTDAGAELERLIEELLCRGVRGVVLEFSRCSTINSLGVASILEIAVRITEDFGGKLLLTGLNDVQQKVMILAGVIPLAAFVPTLAEACAKASEARPVRES